MVRSRVNVAEFVIQNKGGTFKSNWNFLNNFTENTALLLKDEVSCIEHYFNINLKQSVTHLIGQW